MITKNADFVVVLVHLLALIKREYIYLNSVKMIKMNLFVLHADTTVNTKNTFLDASAGRNYFSNKFNFIEE